MADGIELARAASVAALARYPLPKPIPEIAENIRERVASEAGGRKTMVVVDDLEVMGDEGL